MDRSAARDVAFDESSYRGSVKLISVHVAKCAGVSFGRALDMAYGADLVYHEYVDAIADPRSPMHVDPIGFYSAALESGYPWTDGKRVVHGHFHIKKYENYPGPCRRITFLRHPVEHRLSLYYFWQTMPRVGHSLQDYILDNGLNIVDFARLPFVRHFFERLYFAGVDRKLFDFVGTVESLDEDVARLSQLLEKPLTIPHLNHNPDRFQKADSASTRRELKAILRDDIEFYRAWSST